MALVSRGPRDARPGFLLPKPVSDAICQGLRHVSPEMVCPSMSASVHQGGRRSLLTWLLALRGTPPHITQLGRSVRSLGSLPGDTLAGLLPAVGPSLTVDAR